MELERKSECDVIFAEGDATAISLEILSCLETKGFCVVDPGLPASDFTKAREDTDKANTDEKLQRPPEMIVEGLLGAEGSARIMELGIPDSDSSEVPTGLAKLDAAMTETAAIINEFVAEMGFTCPTRTVGIVHETGMTADEAPELGLEEASTWMTTFMRHKLMVMVCLGPIQGTLELRPFDEEAEVYEVPTKPGSMIILRADAMTHRHFAHSRALMLSCFLLESNPAGKGMLAMQELTMVPVAKEIQEWTFLRMKEIKEAEYEYRQPADVPNSWLTAMNHTFCIVQRTAVRGVAGRYPSTFDTNAWYQSQTAGPDTVTEVPLQRWSVQDTYDADPECWRWGKVFVKHGAFMEGAELFEPRFFGLSPQEAKGMDPVQRLVLEVGYEACWMAGFKKGKLMNSLGGVYLGSSCTIFGMVAEVSGATGAAASINSNRFSFCLGLKGPSMTVDTEGSSGLAAIYLGSEGTLDKGRGTVNAYSLAGGVHLQLGTIWYPQLQAAGLLTSNGRCRTFDQSAQGYVQADCCSMACLKRLTETVKGEQVYIEGEPLCGTIAGCAMNSNGLNAKMNAPHGPAQQELVAEALRTAALAPVNIDAVECHGQGAFMNDAIEADSLSRILREHDVDQPLGLTASKSIMAHSNEASGTAAFMKALLANNWGTICPNLHLNQINPHMEPEAKVSYSTEVFEYPLQASFTGAMSHGFGGTNVFAILLGECDPSRVSKLPEDFKREYITFWPGGGGELEEDQVPRRSYYICGTWSGWIPEAMQSEGEGSYGYTVTLGENRWEEFQILLDGEKTRALHPDVPRAHKGVGVTGPDHGVRGLNWRITSSTGSVHAPEALKMIAASPEADLKVVAVGAADLDQVGDQYRVHLKIAGKFRTVTWEKVGRVDPAAIPASQYYITSSWNGWTFDPMTKDGDKWRLEAQLIREGGEFQIVRNQDWSQVIYSDEPGSIAKGPGYGPEDIAMARGYTWSLDGKVGDVFEITFERKADNMTVSWEKLRTDALSEEQKSIAKRPVFSVVGSWTGFMRQTVLSLEKSTVKVPWTGFLASALVHFFVEVGPDGHESFQLLQGCSWDVIIHPNVVVEGSGAPHTLMTSYNDGSASNLVWVIGEADGACPGDVFKVQVSAVGARVSQVTWTKASDAEFKSTEVLRGD
uniref:Ketosynthase family 3 (KS3) domain-containing protein n=1 Tax=Pyrodinium bahamense TaxID=73915 RepID=A0A7S0A995_9DINO|mmetsp:Transcript_27702/g.76261  ORF Transcript_27702/g.76261 Transcript_27702/m.76261 type:complete len:1153 (+) Transcript_27702:1-3459(+)